MKTYTTEEARAKLGSIIQDAVAGIPSAITYHGISAVVIISREEWNKYTERTITITDKDSAFVTETHHR